jgi:LuxR family maltose regulon positive regulatory protein
LIERLNAGLGRNRGFAHTLTLISAPAGFGKTTLLSEWVRQTELPVAWLSLDQGDDDVNHFWRYVIAALQAAQPAVGETAQAALVSPQHPPLDALVTTLINDITALSSPLVLVLDDYHVIRSAKVHTSLSFLLDHMPPQLHIILTTREDPPLALSRRRGRMELVEVRAAELRFTPEEVGIFLNTSVGLDLSVKDVSALEDRTEGWIVGLQMAALSLQERDPSDRHSFVAAFAGDDRYIVDYLMEEVFQHQPPHIQSFLLQTAILERLCGPLCDAVRFGYAKPPSSSTETDSQSILEYLEQVNLFTVPLDNQRHWYRYHHLFADLLRQRLNLSEGEQVITPLYLRASQWCEHEGFIAEAVSYALGIPNPEYAADLIERHVLDLFYRSETVLVYNWLKALPDELLRARPLLCAVYANSMVIRSYSEDDMEVAERWLQDAEKALAARSGSDTHDEAAGFIATFRAYLARFRGDDPQEVIDLSSQALERLPRDDLRFRSALAFNLGMAHLALGDQDAATSAFDRARQIGEVSGDLFNALAATCYQARAARQRGRLHEAATICQETLQSVDGQEGRPIPFIGTVHIALGRVLLEWNDLERASHALTKGLELIKLTAAVDFQTMGCAALAQLKRAQGDVPEALSLLDQAERIWPEATAYIAAQRAWIWLTQAEDNPRYLAAAVQWAQERQLELADEGQYNTEQLVLARLLITQHRIQRLNRATLDQVEPDLQPLFQFLDKQFLVAQGQGFIGWMIEVLTLQAMAMQALGNITQAIAFLERALVLAEPGGYVRIFVDNGTSMARLLYEAAERGIAPSYTGKLLAAFGTETQVKKTEIKDGDASSVPYLSSIEPLSRRELEVLELVAEGLSNKEIAQTLFISPNTVRIHTSNIYGKLGVTNRIQAVTRAQDLGLL